MTDREAQALQSAHRQPNAALVVIFSLLILSMCAAACAAAILVPAPAAAVPFVVAMCVGGPVFAAWELPSAVARLRTARADRRAGMQALFRFRQNLERLPETDHPLGL